MTDPDLRATLTVRFEQPDLVRGTTIRSEVSTQVLTTSDCLDVFEAAMRGAGYAVPIEGLQIVGEE